MGFVASGTGRTLCGEQNSRPEEKDQHAHSSISREILRVKRLDDPYRTHHSARRNRGRDLRKQIKDLEEENAILKKAMRIFTNDRK